MKTLAAIALSVSTLAHAGDWHAPKQSPDDNSNSAEHLMFTGLLPGLFVGTAKPEWSATAQFAVCSIPGVVHEFTPSKGNTWSGRDLLMNSLGCGLGLWAATGFSFGAAPGVVRVSYTLQF